jgi:hypothetical protein
MTKSSAYGTTRECERTTASVGDSEPTPYTLRSTAIFRREGGVRKIVHCHADPVDEAPSRSRDCTTNEGRRRIPWLRNPPTTPPRVLQKFDESLNWAYAAALMCAMGTGHLPVAPVAEDSQDSSVGVVAEWEIELGKDVANVFCDRPFGEVKSLREGAVGVSLRDECEYLTLAVGESGHGIGRRRSWRTTSGSMTVPPAATVRSASANSVMAVTRSLRR